METRNLLFGMLLLAAVPVWAQVVNAGGSTGASGNPAQMTMPPPVSEAGLPLEAGAEVRLNYFSGGVTFNGGYVNNLYAGTGSTTLDDALYVVQPTIAVNHRTDRSGETFTYSPSFTFYDPDSELNTVDQSGNAGYQYRLSPHANFVAGDTVAKTSNTWSQPLSSSVISGGLPSVTPGIVIPFAPQLSNSAYAQMGWQFSLNDMLGFGGATSIFDVSNTPEAQALYNSNSRGGSAFYTHRMTQKQYIGGTYQYSEIAATPVAEKQIAEADLDAHTVLGFYTAYPRPTLSLSLGGGSQYYTISQAGFAPAKAWTPLATGSLGWQGLHSSLAVSVSRLVTEGAGLIGAYSTSSAAVAGHWRITRSWTAGLGGDYADFSNVAGGLAGSLPGGHTVSGTASLGRRLGQYLSFTMQYERLHENYGIQAISSDPNTSFESGSLVYRFSRPLGR